MVSAAGQRMSRSEASEADNPRVPPLLLWASLLEAAVLAGAAVVLFFAPATGRDIWPWQLTPFNTRFLGALYLASLATILPLLLLPRQAPGRLVSSMIFVFSTIIFVISVSYPHQFEWGRPSAYAWFVLFTSVPAIGGYFAGHYRGTGLPPTPPWLRKALLAAAAPLAGYGILLLTAEGRASDFWPWQLDGFHGRVYSAVFITLAAGAVIVAQSGSAIERRTLGLTALVLGCFAIVALAVVDADVNTVHWSSTATIAWLAMFSAVGISGASLLAVSARTE